MESSDSVKRKVVIVIPTYNESKNIQKLIHAIIKILPSAILVIVDDNSPDNTGSIIYRHKNKYKNLHLITRKKKSGRGSAVIAGFTYALKNTAADVFIEMDADFSHNPEELPQFIKKVNSTTNIIGSRYLSTSLISGWPLRRRIISYMANLFLLMLLRYPIRDYTNGYRAYSRKASEELINHTFKTRGFILLSETIVLLHKKGYKAIEIPTVFVNRKEGNSKATVKEFYYSIGGLFSIFYNK